MLRTIHAITLVIAILAATSVTSEASHLIASELRYKWLSGLTYEVTLDLYGDCSSPAGLVSLMHLATPEICIYSGDTLKGNLVLALDVSDSGVIVSPFCPDSAAYTTCTSLTSDIPGIKKFVYTGTYTLPYSSATWCFSFQGYLGSGSDAAGGRAGAITNLYNPGATIMTLIDSLNTTTPRGHNSSPVLFEEPIFATMAFVPQCYNPDAVDLYDSSTLLGEPEGDSLVFSLTTPSSSSGASSCNVPLTAAYCAYIPGLDAWTTPSVQPISPTTPVQCTSGATYSFDSTNGKICFEPIQQKSTVVYNIEEYDHGVLTGTMQREMNFYAVSLPCMGSLAVSAPGAAVQSNVYPNPATGMLTIIAAYQIKTIGITDMLGRALMTGQYNDTRAEIDITSLAPGIYSVKINNSEVRRFVKE